MLLFISYCPIEYLLNPFWQETGGSIDLNNIVMKIIGYMNNDALSQYVQCWP